MRFEQAHVREPDLGSQQLRFVRSGSLQEAVNPVEDLLRLRLDIANRVRRYAAQVIFASHTTARLMIGRPLVPSVTP